MLHQCLQCSKCLKGSFYAEENYIKERLRVQRAMEMVWQVQRHWLWIQRLTDKTRRGFGPYTLGKSTSSQAVYGCAPIFLQCLKTFHCYLLFLPSTKPCDMSISDSCKAYERFHSAHYQDEPFPISKSKLIRYIKFRARSGTFPEFLTNLDQHPEHGSSWLQEMNRDPDVKKLMDLTINLWPRIAKQCKLPLIGVGNVYETPSFEQKYGKYIRDKVNQEAMYRERVHVVEGKKSKGNSRTRRIYHH